MFGSSDVGLTHLNVRPLEGPPIVVQFKEMLVPRSTSTTSSTEAAEGGGGGRECGGRKMEAGERRGFVLDDEVWAVNKLLSSIVA